MPGSCARRRKLVLSNRQRQALYCIGEYFRQTGEAPTAAYVARKLGLSRTTTYAHLEVLADQQLIVSTSHLIPTSDH